MVRLRCIYSVSAVRLRCICSVSAVRLRVVVVVEDIVGDVIVCGASAVRLRCARGTPAAPLLRAYGIVVYSAIAVDWLR